jgi:Gram-negative bacterial TonB protein C-terminal
MSSHAEVYTSSFPGCPTPVVIRILLIESLQALVRDTEEDQQGLLYGVASVAGTEVHGSRPIGGLSVDEVRKAPADESEQVVGYYRIRHGSSLMLTADEFAVAQAVFTKAGSVVLLVERRDTGPEANCFFSEHGAFLNFPLLEFPLDSTVLAQRETQRQKRITEEANKPEHSIDDLALATKRDTAKLEAAPSKRPKMGWPVFAIITFVLFVSLSTGLLLNRRSVFATAALVRSPAATHALLRAERQGDDLTILWDLNSPAIARATSGVLEIVDGGTARQIPMSADQVRFGSLLYSPVSGQISVRLTTLKDEQTTAQASVLVLLNRPTPGTRASAGLQSPPASPTASAQGRLLPFQPTIEAHPQMEIEGKAEGRAATRAFVPPVVDKTTESQLKADYLPPLKTDLVVLPMSFPSVPTPAPAIIANATSEPVRPPEVASPQVSTSSAPARVETVQTPKEDFVAPVLLSQWGVRVPPELPQILKPVAIRVRVDLNEAGRVTHAEAVPEKGIHRLLLQAAMDAARKCTFHPARQGQKPVPSSVTVVFHLEPQK